LTKCYLILFVGIKPTILKNAVIMNPYDKGGLNFLDVSNLNYTFQINWLKQFIKNQFGI
jgi:hypothetical protein